MSRSILLILCALLACSAGAMTVTTESGLIEGPEEAGLLVFKGIPYAAPPIGPLRWRPPQPAPSWTGTRRADHYSPACPQTTAYPPDEPVEATSEDCLTLNIWRPAATAGTPLPVMVWIHGGGLVGGAGSLPVYRGDEWARRGVLLVTINYRLGVLGFLSHPDLSRESPDHASGNYGLLDQIAALAWVQRNIAAFGGDPARVTVGGQSAGSNAISVLAASPLAKGLFHQIVGQSGGMFEPMEAAADFSLQGAEQAGRDFSGGASIDALRAKPVDDLIGLPFDPHPIIDGYVLPASPYDAYRQGHGNGDALLLGYDEGDGLPFIAGRSIGAANLREELSRDFPSLLVRLLGPAPPATDAEAHLAAAGFERDMRFRWDMWAWARLAARSNRQRVFLYRFAIGDAAHGDELAYVFGHAGDGLLLRDWTGFVAQGSPDPAWPQFSETRPLLMNFGEQAGPGPMPDEQPLHRIDRLYGFAHFLMRSWHRLF